MADVDAKAGSSNGSADRLVLIKIVSQTSITLDVLSYKLAAVQKALLNVASSLHGGGRRGKWSGSVLQACTLQFVEARKGSVEVVAELPPRSTLFETDDLGLRAAGHMADTLDAARGGDRGRIRELFPDRGQRARVMKSLSPLLPEAESEYEVLLTLSKRSTSLDDSFRDHLENLIRQDIEELPPGSERRITGYLYLIRVTEGPPELGVVVMNRKIRCHLDSEDEPLVRDLIPGSLVEVEGRALLTADGNIDEFVEVSDISMVEPLLPLLWTRLDHDHRRFRLSEAISVLQEFRDGLWLCSYEPLAIVGWGETRKASMASFRAEFAEVYDYICSESDEMLTVDASELKQRMQRLVLRVEALS